MTVKELIQFLETQPQDIHVVYRCCSERCLLYKEDIEIVTGCTSRVDGWVQNERPDKQQQEYLEFPGN